MAKDLTVEEICVIINTSASAKVSVFSYGDLHIRFGETVQANSVRPANNEPTTPPDAEISEEEHESISQASILEEEIRLKKDRLEQMFIEDPSEAERLIDSGELDGEEDDNEETEYN